jgi:hypothetical protein
MRILEFFKGKQSLPTNQPLVFKDNKSAFEYSCKFMDCKIEPGQVLPALVNRAEPGKENLQVLALTLVSDDGGMEIPFCTTVNEEVPTLAQGDLVAFQIVEFDPTLPLVVGLIGFVVAKLEPALDLVQGWKIAT